MGATAPPLQLPLFSSKSVARSGSNREHCGRGRGGSAKNCCGGNESILRCRSISRVSCGGGSTGNRGGLAGISSGLWSSRAGIGVSSFTGTWVDDIQCKVWNLRALDVGIREQQRGSAPLGVRMMWGGGKVEAQKPNYVPLEQISGEDDFNKVLDEAKERGQPIIVDWLAAWCRKCIYLKPKLEKLAAEYHPDLKFYCVDVNTVPQALVKRANITKMPTIQLWKDGEHVAEVIGGHQAWLVMDEVREMITLKK